MKNGMSCDIHKNDFEMYVLRYLQLHPIAVVWNSSVYIRYKNSKNQTKNLLQDNVYDNMENVSEISQNNFLSGREISTTLHLSLKYP